MIQFFTEFVVFRLAVPRVVVTDNRTQFVGKDLEDTITELDIKHIKSSVAYPRSNGQVEITNNTQCNGHIRH